MSYLQPATRQIQVPSLHHIHVRFHTRHFDHPKGSVTYSSYRCSVQCFREHRDNHPPVEEAKKSPSRDAAKSPTPSDTSNGATSRDVNISKSPNGDKSVHNTPAGPYAGLAEMPEYQMLMKRYPRLPTLLWGIATATDPPTGGNTKAPKFPGSHLHNGHKRDKEPWTQEKGVQNAVHVLRKTRNSPGDDSDALREFSELVRLFKARKEEEAASSVFRKKYMQESAEVIGQLMRSEKAGVM